MAITFLQSKEWGEILKKEGKRIEQPSGEAQFVCQKLFFGWQYAFAPGGEINDFDVVVDYFRKRKMIFLRFEPAQLQGATYSIKKTTDITPRATIILDLTKPQEELLSAMHEKTRYNIRLAQKKGLEVKGGLSAKGGPASGGKDLDSFWMLSEATAKRDGFRLHPRAHYKVILDSGLSHQVTVFQNDTPVASGIFIGFGNTFTYLFGASDHNFRQLMAPYLVQWEGIKLGKELGYAKYDFFGVAPRCHSDPPAGGEESLSQSPPDRDPSVAALPQDDKYEYDSNHQYAKVTRFKLGFGGSPSERPGTYDLIISPGKYKIYQLLRKLRRLV